MEDNKDDLKNQFLHESVLHIRQRYKWDCGIACVKMVLSSFPSNTLWTKRVDEEMAEIRRNPLTNFETRPWTIDLCNMLYRLRVNFTYFTTSKQATEAMSSLPFYSKSFKKDKNRVDELFKTSPMRTQIIERSLSTTDLVDVLKSGPLILLVNSYELKCHICKCKAIRSNQLLLGCCGISEPPFIGHYIVLVGFSMTSGFLYKNPAIKEELCSIQAQELDVARRTAGTDQDIVAVNFCFDDGMPKREVEPLPSTQHSQLD